MYIDIYRYKCVSQSYLVVGISNTRLFVFPGTNVFEYKQSLVWEIPTTRYDWQIDLVLSCLLPIEILGSQSYLSAAVVKYN